MNPYYPPGYIPPPGVYPQQYGYPTVSVVQPTVGYTIPPPVVYPQYNAYPPAPVYGMGMGVPQPMYPTGMGQSLATPTTYPGQPVPIGVNYSNRSASGHKFKGNFRIKNERRHFFQ
ncbi:hypothetical protein DFA_08753 [Cavenderia fasciculata]|uniref:Uncharacterized protein n=1 Tax=Cavenderia fasciculata TaxID=261658 RepID=F4Q452_CACFS|nr:uncharacterized protein DFA_08753 [Cavenderia fasciculata]EGG17754.1 hypothetical protein DFA_08753 [Cavenderia fasciculata]|eukprot:XP_004356238.1 hypothetical protein DFA_08753 [Cavenderia fasciculata]